MSEVNSWVASNIILISVILSRANMIWSNPAKKNIKTDIPQKLAQFWSLIYLFLCFIIFEISIFSLLYENSDETLSLLASISSTFLINLLLKYTNINMNSIIVNTKIEATIEKE